MKRKIAITFTKLGSPHVRTDTILVESPTTERVQDSLSRRMRKFTRTPVVLQSWALATETTV